MRCVNSEGCKIQQCCTHPILFVEMCTWTETVQTKASCAMWETNQVFFLNSSATLEAQALCEGVNDCQQWREGHAVIWSTVHSMGSKLSISWEQFMTSLFVLNMSGFTSCLKKKEKKKRTQNWFVMAFEDIKWTWDIQVPDGQQSSCYCSEKLKVLLMSEVTTSAIDRIWILLPLDAYIFLEHTSWSAMSIC